MNHKRKRPKNRRAGCLMCKPHKMNGACPRHLDMRMGDRRRFMATEVVPEMNDVQRQMVDFLSWETT